MAQRATRLQRILFAVLALQIVAAVVVFWPQTAAGGEGGPLFAELDTEAVASITLDDGEGTRTELVRQDDGWVLGGVGYPVDGEKVEPILAKIAAIQANRLVARSSSSYERLQVAEDDFAQKIELRMDNGVLETLLLGSSPNPGGTHVRRASRPETYLTGELASWEVNPAVNNWIDTQYTSLDRTEIAAMTLVNGNGRFEFTKESEDDWHLAELPEDRDLEQSRLNALLSRVTGLRMVEPLGTTNRAEYGLAAPQAELTVVVEDSEEQSTRQYTLLVGAQDPADDRFFAKWSDSDYYVKVESFNVENMVNHVLDDFIAEPPTPTPSGDESVEPVTPTPES